MSNDDDYLIPHELLKYFGVIFIVLGTFGFVVILVLGVLKILMWWQSIIIGIGLVIMIIIGFLMFKQGRYYIKTKTLRRLS